jgi:hypothetical protein
MGKTLNRESLKRIEIRFPSVSEQERLCDAFERRDALVEALAKEESRKSELGSRLTKASLEALTTAETPEEFALAWKRVSENFDTLIDRSEKVEDLRNAILGSLIGGFPREDGRLQFDRAAVAYADRFKARVFRSLWSFELENGMLPLAALLETPLINGRSVPDGVGARVLRLSAFRTQYLNYADHKAGDWSLDPAPFYVAEGDLFLVRGNGALRLVGRASIAGPLPNFEVAFPDTAIRVRTNPTLIDTTWLWYFLQSHIGRSQIERSAKTTAGIFKISQRDVEAIRVPAISIESQHVVVSRISALMAFCDQLENKLRAAEELAAKFAESVVRGVTA